MAKPLLLFFTLLFLKGMLAAASSAAFDEWLSTFDSSTSAASKVVDCGGKPDGLYADEPDTCSSTYYACLSGNAYRQTCADDNVFDSSPAVKSCVDFYSAQSPACASYPVPSCNTNPLTEFLPIGRCSDIAYACTSTTGPPLFIKCGSGLPFDYFDPVTKVCRSTAGVKNCECIINSSQ